MGRPPEQVARDFAAAINGRKVEDILSLMTGDHVFIDSLGNRVSGKPQLEAAWAAYLGMIRDYAIEIGETFAQGPVVVLLGSARGSFSETHWTMPAAWRAVVRDSLVAEWRVYADQEPLRRIMARAQSGT